MEGYLHPQLFFILVNSRRDISFYDQIVKPCEEFYISLSLQYEKVGFCFPGSRLRMSIILESN